MRRSNILANVRSRSVSMQTLFCKHGVPPGRPSGAGVEKCSHRCNANAFIVHDMQSNRRLLAGSLLHRERGFSFSTVLSKLLAACPSFLTTIHQSVNHHLSSHTFSTQLCSGVRCWKSAYCIKRFLKFVCICIFL